MTDRIANLWGKRTPFGAGEDWPVRVDQFLEEGVSEDDVDPPPGLPFIGLATPKFGRAPPIPPRLPNALILAHASAECSRW